MRPQLIPALVLACGAIALVSSAAPARSATDVKTLTFSYTAHDGAARIAYLVLPAWYGSDRHPPIPLVISAHGRGVDGAYNLRFWGELPADGPFALVSPDGQGRRLPLYSWGYGGQIDDLMRMPELARAAFPWLELNGRTYAIGSSMGAQESLLLLARRDAKLAGVVAFDPVTDMAARYRKWPLTPGERNLPALARTEFGGSPAQAPQAYAARSPASRVRAIARSDVPLQLWWSHADTVVTDQALQTGAFYIRLGAISPRAPVHQIVGYWQHAHEFHPQTQLRAALACFHLVPAAGVRVPAYVRRRDGTIGELPPHSGRPEVPFTRAFCGRAGS
jgi:pimeloyl-ACP methyl ester carboxylesterase